MESTVSKASDEAAVEREERCRRSAGKVERYSSIAGDILNSDKSRWKRDVEWGSSLEAWSATGGLISSFSWVKTDSLDSTRGKMFLRAPAVNSRFA